MVGRGLSWLLGALLAVGVSGWCRAGEGEAPKPPEAKKEESVKPPDELRSATGKLVYARRQFIKSKPELADQLKQIQDKVKAAQKEELEFYAKLRTLSPEIDALEKQKEELEAARKKQHEERKGKRGPK